MTGSVQRHLSGRSGRRLAPGKEQARWSKPATSRSPVTYQLKGGVERSPGSKCERPRPQAMLLAHIRIDYPEFRSSRLLPFLAICGLPRVELDDDLLADPTHIDQGSLRAGSGRRTRPFAFRFPLFMFNGVALRIPRWARNKSRAGACHRPRNWPSPSPAALPTPKPRAVDCRYSANEKVGWFGVPAFTFPLADKSPFHLRNAVPSAPYQLTDGNCP